MKTFLVPTDFSEAANNAMYYAAGLAKLSGANLLLFHAYHIPTIMSEQVIALPGIGEIEEECYNRLALLQEQIQELPGRTIGITCICSCGLAVDEIDLMAREWNADLVIVGMQGSGYIADKVFGNVTTALIHKTEYPLLVIGKNVGFKPMDKIVFAYDQHKLTDSSQFSILREMADLFLSHLYIVTVENQPDLYDMALRKIRQTKLRHWLEDVYTTFHTVQHKDVSTGLNSFMAEREPGMLVMVPREHSFFEAIFHTSATSKIAYQTTIPLLILHE